MLFIGTAVFSQSLSLVGEHQVSPSTKVITLKSSTPTINSTDDTQAVPQLIQTQQQIITHLSAINGVSEATFDSATNTYTIVATKETQLVLPLALSK